MSRLYVLLACFQLYLVICHCEPQETTEYPSVFAAQPGDTYLTGIIGRSLKVPCVLTSPVAKAVLKWEIKTKSSRTLAIASGYRVYTEFTRYYILSQSATNKATDFSLTIRNVSSEELPLRCLVEDLPSSWSNIVIAGAPHEDYPVCKMEPDREVNAGELVTINCISVGGVPPAALSWETADGSTAINPGPGIRISSNLERTSMTGRILTHRFLSVGRKLHGQTFVCKAANTATIFFKITLSCSITISVRYPPGTVSLSMIPPKVYPGDRVTLICSVSHAGRPEAEIIWFKDGRHLESHNQPTLVRSNVSSSVSDGSYKCAFRNRVGMSESSVRNVSVDHKHEELGEHGTTPISSTVKVVSELTYGHVSTRWRTHTKMVSSTKMYNTPNFTENAESPRPVSLFDGSPLLTVIVIVCSSTVALLVLILVAAFCQRKSKKRRRLQINRRLRSIQENETTKHTDIPLYRLL